MRPFLGHVLMRRKNVWTHWQLAAGEKDTILSLRPPRGLNLLVAFVCGLVAIGISLIESAGYLERPLALTAVGCLAIVVGLAAANVLHPLLEVRLDRDGLLIRDPWGLQRYLWRDILEPFRVVAGESRRRVTFTWYSAGAIKRAFVSPDCLRISAADLAALLNDQWKQARRSGTTTATGVQLGDATSEAVGHR